MGSHKNIHCQFQIIEISSLLHESETCILTSAMERQILAFEFSACGRLLWCILYTINSTVCEHIEVRSRNEGCIGESDNLLKTVRNGKVMRWSNIYGMVVEGEGGEGVKTPTLSDHTIVHWEEHCRCWTTIKTVNIIM